jgi:putative ABC transport system permease protein
MFIHIAFKNIFRNKRRTLLTMAAVFFGVFLLIVFNGFSSGMEWQIGDLFIKTNTGAIKIVVKDFKTDDLENPIDFPLAQYRDIGRKLAQNKKIQAYSPRITFHGSVSNGMDEIRAVGVGMDPVLEDAVFQRKLSIVNGSFLNPHEEGIVIGEELAGLLNVTVGDTVSVIAQATAMGRNAYDLEIKGLIKTGNPLIDGYTFFVPIDFARGLLSFEGITDIAVNLKSYAEIDQVANEIRQQTFQEDIKVLTWRDFAKDYIGLIEYRKKMIGIISCVILLIAAVGIINTMLMAMLERKREIGNLMAMGVRRTEIMRLFSLEGGFIGVLGSLSAAVLGSLVLLYGQIAGLPINLNEIGNTPVAGKLYLHLNLNNVFYFFLVGIAVAILSAIYPAFKSAQLNPVEALRENRR